MSYELRALVSRYDATDGAARAAGCHTVRLPQGYGLVPVTSDVFDRLGGGEVRPFGDAFWFLSSGIAALARQASMTAPVAYLEAETFGGTGTQAMMLWRDGEVWVGPATTQATAARQSAEDWAVNRALRHLGVERLGAVDEFDALGLGRHRHTEDWFTGGG